MKKAFTLIEVLVAVFLLSLLLASLMFAFKLFIKKLNDLVYTLPTRSINYELIYKNISAFYPYFLQSRDKKQLKLFFKNEKNYIEYISNYPLYYNRMVISRLECSNHKLLYSESLLFDKKQNYNNPVVFQNNFKKVLFKYKHICKIDVQKNDNNFPELITVFIDDKKMIFPVISNYYRLKGLLKENI
jgi:prepilin-type N-terminal cleavage/methylation domain-containing protein